MQKGKIGAQCGHATLGAYRLAEKKCKSALSKWLYLGQTKVALKIDDDAMLLELYEKASKLGLVAYYVIDEGRTQIAPGSKTILAIGPGPESIINEITGKLKLL